MLTLTHTLIRKGTQWVFAFLVLVVLNFMQASVAASSTE